MIYQIVDKESHDYNFYFFFRNLFAHSFILLANHIKCCQCEPQLIMLNTASLTEEYV